MATLASACAGRCLAHLLLVRPSPLQRSHTAAARLREKLRSGCFCRATAWQHSAQGHSPCASRSMSSPCRRSTSLDRSRAPGEGCAHSTVPLDRVAQLGFVAMLAAIRRSDAVLVDGGVCGDDQQPADVTQIAARVGACATRRQTDAAPGWGRSRAGGCCCSCHRRCRRHWRCRSEQMQLGVLLFSLSLRGARLVHVARMRAHTLLRCATLVTGLCITSVCSSVLAARGINMLATP
jgi:hypothetical protein